MRRLPVISPSPLPPRYEAWMLEALGGPVPAETEATCGDCVMLDADEGSAESFHPETKCCTYLPSLPNFLIGDILRDGDPAARAGRATVVKRIKQGVAVSPIGLGVSEPFTQRYEHASSTGDFGRARELRCPHYRDARGGSCGIWRHRNAACATWFCKHTRGAVGITLWRDAIEPLLRAAESALVRHSLLTLGWSTDGLSASWSLVETAALRSERAPRVDRDVEARAWGPWAGREIALYEACADAVVGLTWGDVARIGGEELRAREAAAREVYAGYVSRTIPARLRSVPVSVTSTRDGAVRVVTYSEYDPLELPVELIEALHAFDGRPTRSVTAELARERGLELDDEVLGQLVDFGLLAPAE